MNRYMIRMAMMAVLSIFIAGCKVQRHSTEKTVIDKDAQSTIDMNCRQLTTDDLHRIVREKEDWHIVWYDTSTCQDSVTGKHAIAAEAWINKESHTDEEETVTDTQAHEMNEATIDRTHEQQYKEQDMTMKTGPEWWHMMAIGAGAMIVLLILIMIRRASNL